MKKIFVLALIILGSGAAYGQEVEVTDTYEFDNAAEIADWTV